MKRLLFLFFFLLLNKAHAQELFFSNPASFQNLPSSETYQIFQDSKGIIWVCTDAGICRYNGNSLTTFTTKDGISENVVLRAYEDDKKRIWFNTLSGYFFYYENKIFHAIAANEELKKLCNSYPMTSFYIGEQDTLYCASAKLMGVTKIPPQHNYKNIIRDTLSFTRVHRFLISNKLHPEESIIGRGNLLKYDDIHKCISSHDNKIDTVTIREIDRFVGNYFIGKIDLHKTFYLPSGMQFNIITQAGDIKLHYFPLSISYCYMDKDSDLWVGTIRGGGYLYKNADLSKPPVRFLNNLSVSSVMIDREGIIWVTTLEKGIFQSMNKRLLFFNEKDDKAIYLQKDSNHLNISYASHKIVSIYKNDSLSVNNIKKIINSTADLSASFIDEHYQYYGTGTEIFRLGSQKKAIDLFKFTQRTNVIDILKTGKDSILLLSPPALIKFYHGKEQIIISPFPNRSMIQLKNKKILISSRNNSGIYEFKNDRFIHYLDNLPQLKTRINCMLEDKFGNLWIATNEHGLYCYDHNKKLHHFANVEDKINALAFDSKNQLWVGTNNGISKICFTTDLNKLLITHFKKNHGIPNEEIKTLVEFNGKIGCIAKDLFFYFDSEQLQKNNVPPLTYIDSVFINDKAYDLNQEPVLKYDKNNIHILTSLISNRNNHKEYLYQLAGYDQNWHYSASGDMQYTNLPHGTYTFMVYGLNNDKVKSDKPATFTFTIEKPFWLTWWFILLEISIISIVIYFSIHYWKHKIEKREREKAAISEFKMTALRSQMNPHFIFNAIGSIQHYILKNEVKQSYNYLSKFSMLIRNILNNSRQEFISLTQEINTLRLYIELEQIRFTHPFQFKIEIDEALDMEMDIPTMLIQPYVENSIWHGLMPKESDGLLELTFKKVDDSMLVIIRDNGMGRKITDPAKKHVSKGMSITEQRINILATTSKKQFVTNIIDLKDENGNSSGTEVNLIIPLDLE
jgi:ligand-binding sensor domain-containing protein/two-component sensor histidine kinase